VTLLIYKNGNLGFESTSNNFSFLKYNFEKDNTSVVTTNSFVHKPLPMNALIGDDGDFVFSWDSQYDISYQGAFKSTWGLADYGNGLAVFSIKTQRVRYAEGTYDYDTVVNPTFEIDEVVSEYIFNFSINSTGDIQEFGMNYLEGDYSWNVSGSLEK